MREATKILVSARPESELVHVRWEERPNTQPNHCIRNTVLLTRRDHRYSVAGGWLVGDFLPKLGAAAIPHLWLLDSADGSHIDITPQLTPPDAPFEYVYDRGVIDCWLEISKLPLPLRICEDGRMQARWEAGSFISLSSLDIALLKHLAQEAADPMPDR